MIDIEPDVFTIVATAVRDKYPNVYMTGEYVPSPPSFPCVSIVEVDNSVYRRTRTTDDAENHASLLYEVNVYANKQTGKKAECKAILSLVDATLGRIGFERTMTNPVPNLADATIYRMIGRYRAVISKDKIIFRR